MDQRIINLKRWIKEEHVPPEEVQIYPTNKCNLKCVFCYQRLNQYDVKDEIPDKRWLEIAEELCNIGVKKILISGGGEPLMATATLKMMKLFKLRGLHGRLINNGTLWSDETILDVINIGWDTIMFSIDSPNARTHDKLRGVKGCFDKAIQNMKRFKELKNSENKSKPRVEINFVLNKLNYKEVSDMIDLASRLNLDFLNFEPICMNNQEASKLKLEEHERAYFLERIVPQAITLSNKLNIGTNLDTLLRIKVIEKAGELDNVILNNPKPSPLTKPWLLDAACFEPWLWPKIEANGEVWPCSTVPLKANIKRKSFKEVWLGEELTEFRNNIVKGILSESCKNCVMTHLPVNKEIRERLKKELK